MDEAAERVDRRPVFRFSVFPTWRKTSLSPLWCRRVGNLTRFKDNQDPRFVGAVQFMATKRVVFGIEAHSGFRRSSIWQLWAVGIQFVGCFPISFPNQVPTEISIDDARFTVIFPDLQMEYTSWFLSAFRGGAFCAVHVPECIAKWSFFSSSFCRPVACDRRKRHETCAGARGLITHRVVLRSLTYRCGPPPPSHPHFIRHSETSFRSCLAADTHCGLWPSPGRPRSKVPITLSRPPVSVAA